MLYCCENCGKKYYTKEQALDCEKRHAEEKARLEELTKEKEARTQAIEKSIKTLETEIEKFYEDYGTYPNVSMTICRNAPIPSVIRYLLG